MVPRAPPAFTWRRAGPWQDSQRTPNLRRLDGIAGRRMSSCPVEWHWKQRRAVAVESKVRKRRSDPVLCPGVGAMDFVAG